MSLCGFTHCHNYTACPNNNALIRWKIFMLK
jgi:hypothetical protein